MKREFVDNTNEAVFTRNFKSEQKFNKFRVLSSIDNSRPDMAPVEYPKGLIDAHRTKFGVQSANY